jgi:hypothetical protein
VNVGVDFLHVKIGWHLTVTQHKDRFDETSHACRALEVANVGLDRADNEWPCRQLGPTGSEDLTQGLNLDRISKRRAWQFVWARGKAGVSE